MGREYKQKYPQCTTHYATLNAQLVSLSWRDGRWPLLSTRFQYLQPLTVNSGDMGSEERQLLNRLTAYGKCQFVPVQYTGTENDKQSLLLLVNLVKSHLNVFNNACHKWRSIELPTWLAVPTTQAWAPIPSQRNLWVREELEAVGLVDERTQLWQTIGSQPPMDLLLIDNHFLSDGPGLYIRLHLRLC